METHLRTELVLRALSMALLRRRPQQVIHQPDRACQSNSQAFDKRRQEKDIMPSMRAVCDAYDNAMAESFFAALECEPLNRCRFKTLTEDPLRYSNG